MDFIDTIKQFFSSIGALTTVRWEIEAVDFVNDDIIFRFLGNLRYIIGDVPYNLIFLSIQIGGVMIIYKLIRNVVNVILTLIPGLKDIRFGFP